MSTIMKSGSFELGTNGSGIDVTSHDEAVTFYVPLTPEQRRALADAIAPERDFSGVDWKAMYEQACSERDEAVRRVEKVEAERDDWMRRSTAHAEDAETAERERDQARESLRRLRDETDFDLFTVRDQLKQCRGEREQMTRARDEWRARAEAAVARAAPAVSRADVAEALSRCLNPEMWNVTFPSVVNEVCDLFGVEAEQATDPVEAKARELAGVMHEAIKDERVEWHSAPAAVDVMAARLAAHVLGQETNDE